MSRFNAKSRRVRSLIVTSAMLAAPCAMARGQVSNLSKGQQLLSSRGLQIDGVVALTSDPFHLATLQSTNFTAPLWAWTPDVSTLGAAPGAPWSKWIDYTTQSDLPSGEQAYKSNLVAMAVGDEQNLADSTTYSGSVTWFNTNRNNFPGTILYTDQWGTEIAEGTMINFVHDANPDAVNFDNYPFVQGGGSFIAEEYADLSKYRRLGLGIYIGASANPPRPYGTYIQTYQSTGDNRRAPSDSEMRLQLFEAWTCGYTFASTFTYNSGASTLFTNGGDNTITSYGTQFKESARQSRNLGPALVNLISKGAASRFIPGQDSAGNPHDIPSGWVNWAPGAEADPYISSISASNPGTKNNGHPGDCLVGYFNPMLDSYDGPAWTNELYFMITNGLDDPTGTVADCAQNITVNFSFAGSGINSLLRLRRSDGQVETVPLTHISGTQYQLTLALDGGTGDLFKFNDGAPFVGVQSPSTTYWDGDANAGNNNFSTGSGLGGNGTWDSASSRWSNGSTNGAWAGGKDAVFWGGGGTVTLSSSQTAGSLAFLSNGYSLVATEGGSLTMTGSAIMADAGVTANISTTLAGSLGLVKNGAGTINLSSAANPYTNGTTINGGVLAVRSDVSLGPVPTSPGINIVINNGSTLRSNASLSLAGNRQILLGPGGGAIDTNGSTLTVAGVISGSSLTKAGIGTLILSASNNYTGGTTVNGGTLQISSDSNLGAVPTSFMAGNITLNGTLQFGGNFDISNNRGITLSATGGTIDTEGFSNPSGYGAANSFSGGNLTKIGAGTFFAGATSGGLNTLWTGNLIIRQGTLKILATDGLPINPSTGGLRPAQVTLDGGTWQFGAGLFASQSNRGITVTSNGGTIDTQSFNVTWAGPIAGASPSAILTKNGSGTLRFNSSSYPGAYTGHLLVNAGTLQIDGANAVGTQVALSLADSPGVQLNLTGAGQTLGSLNGGGTMGGNVSLAAFSYSFGGNNNSTTFAGNITGAGSLIKAGSGTMTLAGSNTYTGSTTVNSGILTVLSPSSVPANKPVTINAGQYVVAGAGNYSLSTLTINGNGNAYLFSGIDKSLTLSAAPTIAPGAQLDLDDGAMIVNYGSQTTHATRDAIRNLLINGRNAPPASPAPWNGLGGIVSYSANANGNGFNLAMAYADNQDLAAVRAAGSYTSFAGQNISSTCVLVKLTFGADATMDGVVDGQDVAIIGTHFQKPGSGQWCFGDFDYSGTCDGSDVAVLGTTFGKTSPILSPAQMTAEFGAAFTSAFEAGQNGVVPEPETVMAAAVGFSIIAFSRRRRREFSPHKPGHCGI